MRFVQQGQGGTLEHIMTDVPHDGTRWDASPAPTCTLKAADGGVILASQTVTDLGTATTVSAAGAASGQKTIPVASTTGFERGEQVWIGPNASGEWESGILDQVGASSLGVLHELQYDYVSTNVVKSHRLRITVTAAQAASQYTRARAVWGYTVDSVTRTVDEEFHIVPHVPRHTVTESTLRDLFPRSWVQRGSDQRLPRLIDTHWRRYVLADLGAGYKPGALIDSSAMNEALIYRVLATLALEAREVDQYQEYMKLYSGRVSAGFQISTVDDDLDGDAGSHEKYRGRYSGRLLRG